MILSIHITNFKAFGETTEFRIRPLTLLYGENSSGKSSFFHALLFLHELLMSGNADIFHPRSAGQIVDLGGFRQVTFGHDLGRSIRFRISFRSEEQFVPWNAPALKGAGIALEFVVQRCHKGDGISAIRLLRHGSIAMEATRGSVIEPFEATVKARSADTGQAPGAAATKLTLHGFTGNWSTPTFEPAAEDNLPLPPECDILVQSCAVLMDWLGGMKYLGPLRAYPSRSFRLDTGSALSDSASGITEWETLRNSAEDASEVRARVNAWFARMPSSRLSSFVVRSWLGAENFDALWDAERTRSREEIRSALADITTDPHLDIVSLESVLLDLRDRLDLQFMTLSEAVRNRANRSFELMIADAWTGALLSHRDVGMGYSQLVPILVACVARRDTPILIEQPELHVHPGLQCELGDLFLESAFSGGNTVLIETHSEHLLLRLMRRLREQQEANEQMAEELAAPTALTEQEIQVTYLTRSQSGTAVQNFDLRRDGRGFTGKWPDEFFGERMRELF